MAIKISGKVNRVGKPATPQAQFFSMFILSPVMVFNPDNGAMFGMVNQALAQGWVVEDQTGIKVGPESKTVRLTETGEGLLAQALEAGEIEILRQYVGKAQGIIDKHGKI